MDLLTPYLSCENVHHYNFLQNKLNNESISDVPELPVPLLETTSLKVLVGPTRPLTTPGKTPALGINFNTVEDAQSESKWTRLEEMLLTEAEGSPPMVFKPIITLYSISKLQKHVPIAIVNEPIQIQLTLSNVLQTVLNLKDIYLIWKYENDTDTVSNEDDSAKSDAFVKTHTNKNIIIEGNQKSDIILSLTPLSIGKITILGICYTITTTDTIFIKGKQLFDLPKLPLKKSTDKTTTNSQLVINIVPPAPCLQVISFT